MNVSASNLKAFKIVSEKKLIVRRTRRKWELRAETRYLPENELEIIKRTPGIEIRILEK